MNDAVKVDNLREEYGGRPGAKFRVGDIVEPLNVGYLLTGGKRYEVTRVYHDGYEHRIGYINDEGRPDGWGEDNFTLVSRQYGWTATASKPQLVAEVEHDGKVFAISIRNVRPKFKVGESVRVSGTFAGLQPDGATARILADYAGESRLYCVPLSSMVAA